jgi:hypothetical protein
MRPRGAVIAAIDQIAVAVEGHERHAVAGSAAAAISAAIFGPAARIPTSRRFRDVDEPDIGILADRREQRRLRVAPGERRPLPSALRNVSNPRQSCARGFERGTRQACTVRSSSGMVSSQEQIRTVRGPSAMPCSRGHPLWWRDRLLSYKYSKQKSHPWEAFGKRLMATVSTLDLPPPFRLVTLREVGDAMAHAIAIAGEAGAGTLVHVGRFDLAEFAVVLEPDEPLQQAPRAFTPGRPRLPMRWRCMRRRRSPWCSIGLTRSASTVGSSVACGWSGRSAPMKTNRRRGWCSAP